MKLTAAALLLLVMPMTLHAQQSGDEGSAQQQPGEESPQGMAPAQESAPGAPSGNDSAGGNTPADAVNALKNAQLAPKQELDLTFLNLPAYDVEPVDPNPARVGDQLALKVVNAAGLPTTTGFKLGLPKGTEVGTVLDQGLDVPALTGNDDTGSPAVEATPAPAAAPTSAGSAAASATPASAVTAVGSDLHFTVIAAKPGQIAIPSLAIQDGTGKTIARTNPFTLPVASAIKQGDEKAKEPSPPRPPVDLSFPWIVIAALVALGLALLGGIIYAIVRYARRAKPAPVAAPGPPPKTEDEIALASFAELEKLQLMRQGLYKKHYFQISETIKNYLGARYQVDAAESTTREMIAMLGHTTLPPDSLRELSGMFVQLDMVKFTDRVPEIPEGEELLARAKALVIKTRKPPSVAPAILPSNLDSKGATRAL